jgi:hypothetical protein
MKNLRLLLLLLAFSQSALAQLSVIKRADMEINRKEGDNYKILSLRNDGLLVFLESEEYVKGGKKQLIITKYDTTLQVTWSRSVTIEYSSNLGMHSQDGEYIYFLVPQEDKKYEILKIHLNSGLLSMIKYEKLAELEITHFVASENILLFGGMVDSRPVVVHYDYVNLKAKVLPTINTLKANINRLEICPNDKSIFILLTPNTNKKDERFFYTIFDITGKLLSNIAVPYEKNVDGERETDDILFTFQPYLISSNEFYLFGMYSLLAKDKAQGIYVMHILNNQQPEPTRFYDFAYLKNFFNYLGKRKDKVISKIKEERQEGNIYKHDYSILARELKIVDDKIIFVADSYTPLYREGMNQFTPINMGLLRYSDMSLRNMMYANDFMRSPMTRGVVGYRYRHGIVCAFDKKGKLLWDNSLEYKDLETSLNLQPQIQVSSGIDSLTMIYMNDRKIFYKRTDKSLPVEEIRETEIPSKEDADKMLNDREKESFTAWYGDYFLMYGIQQYRGGANGNSRKVFYLSKIAYFPPKIEEKKAD